MTDVEAVVAGIDHDHGEYSSLALWSFWVLMFTFTVNAVVAHTLGPDPAVVVQSQSPGVAHQHLAQPVHVPDPEVTVVIRKAIGRIKLLSR